MWWWLALWTAVAGAAALGMVASASSLTFARRVATEMQDVRAAASTPAPPDLRRLADLPAPARNYLSLALGGNPEAFRTVTLHHRGTFRPSLNGSWLAIEGRQLFTADPPGFVWWGRVRLAPGIWIDARDRSVAGTGGMLVRVESAITVADSRGPELDQSALARLLGELAWAPAVLLDERYVRWTPVDERRAAATLSLPGCGVTGTFEFGEDGLPARFRAARYRDVGEGRSVLTPFVGQLSDFRRERGVLVPHRATGTWMIDGQPFEYARFDVDAVVADTGVTPATGALHPPREREDMPDSRATSSSR